VSWYDTALSPIMWVISWLVVQFHRLFSQVFAPSSGWAWGLAIVFLTLTIRVLLIPLFVKQIKSMRAMQVIQPEIKALQDKYKRDIERAKFDPVKKRDLQQKQQREMMALYKEHGTNPFASCLPVLAQSPFWASLYRLLYNVANGTTFAFMTKALVDSINSAHVLGAPISAHFNSATAALHGASSADVKAVSGAMIVICMVTQFITQRQMILKNSAPDNPMVKQQKMLMYVMPLMLGLFYLIAPIGVLIYMLTSNLWTMGQQFYVLHNNPTPGSLAHEEHLKRKAAKAAKKAKPASDDAPTSEPQDEAPAASLTSTGRPKPQRNQPTRTTKSQRTKR
jgi:YidC/Oxa1 family membrane protein insertase